MRDGLHGCEKAVLEYYLKPQIFMIPFNETSDGKSKEFISNFLKKIKESGRAFFAINYFTQAGLELL